MAPRLEPDGGYIGLCPPGLRQSGTHGLKERKGHYRAKLAYLSQNAINATPIFSLTGGLKKQSQITDPEYRWHEQPYETRAMNAVAAYDDAGGMSGSIGVIVLAGATWMMHEGILLKNHFTGEIMRVVCAPSFIDPAGKLPTQVQVIRGFSGTTPRAFDPEDPVIQGLCGGKVVLHMIGSAFSEGSCTPTSITSDPNMHHNYTHILRKGHSITGTAQATGYKFGPKEKQDQMRMATQFNEDAEMALLFSEMSISNQGGKLMRTMHGLVPQIRDRAPDNYIIRQPDSKLGWTEFEDLMERVFLYGSKTKMAFVGPRTLRTLRHLVRMNSEKAEATEKQKVFGRMQVATFEMMGYTLHVHEHPMFRDAGYPWDSAMLILDMEDMEFLALKGRDVKYRKFSSIESNDCGLDGEVYGWIAELTTVLISAQRHAVILGICEAGEDCFECATPTEYEHPTPVEECDPCLDPVHLPDELPAFACETCGTNDCGCGGSKGTDSSLEPLTDNNAVLEALAGETTEETVATTLEGTVAPQNADTTDATVFTFSGSVTGSPSALPTIEGVDVDGVWVVSNELVTFTPTNVWPNTGGTVVYSFAGLSDEAGPVTVADQSILITV